MKNMHIKRLFKIIFTNIVVFTVIIVTLEFIAYAIDYFRIKDFFISNNKFNLQSYPLKIYSFSEFYQINKKEDGYFRPESGIEYKNKPPILLLGCSYTYGHRLKYEETFGLKLSQFAKRHVINKAVCRYGVNTALFQLQHD